MSQIAAADSVRTDEIPSGKGYARRVEITTKTADQVRIPKVERGEAVVVTRHGVPIAAVVTVEDLRLIQAVRAAMPATEPLPVTEAVTEAWAEDPPYTEAELESMQGLRPCR